MTDRHKVLFEWPHSEPTEVVVAGSFNDWARTCRLTRESTGFTGFIHIPWGSKITYKYIVDGTWTTHPDQPTEPDYDGNINNTYIAPPQPESDSNGKGTPAPGEVSDLTTQSLPQLVAHLADTVVAREGTSSTLEYVASGFGAALNSVVGVDPINPEQIAIPTPIQSAATTTTEFNVPGSAVSDGAPLPSIHIDVPSPLHPVSETPVDPENPKAVPTSELPAKVASDISVPIVPVNAAENNVIPTPAVNPVIAEGDVRDASREMKGEQAEKSTHIAVKVNEDIPVHVEDETNKALKPPMAVEEPHAAAIKKTSAADSVLAEKEATPKVMHMPLAAAPDDPLVTSVDYASAPEVLFKDPAIVKTPEATPSLNPSVLVSKKLTTGAAPSAVLEAKARSQDKPVVPVERLQKELDESEQTKSETVVDEAKVGPAPVSAPELSLEMSHDAIGPAAAEIASELAREPETNREKGESVLVESALFTENILVSQTPQRAMEGGTEPPVELESAKREEKESESETKQGEPRSAPTQNTTLLSELRPVSVATTGAAFVEPILAPTVEVVQMDQVALATKATPTEPMSPLVAEARPAESFSASTIEVVPTEHVSVPTTQAAPTKLAPISVSAAAASVVPNTEAALRETPPEPMSVPPVSEPSTAALTPSNGRAKEVARPVLVPPAPAKAVSPSTVSPTVSPSKSAKVTPVRRKTSSIFGRIKHFFESGKDNSKK